MNRIANSIKNRLSLRPPHAESLNILADLADKLTLGKNTDLASELEKVKTSFTKTCCRLGDIKRSATFMARGRKAD